MISVTGVDPGLAKEERAHLEERRRDAEEGPSWVVLRVVKASGSAFLLVQSGLLDDLYNSAFSSILRSMQSLTFAVCSEWMENAMTEGKVPHFLLLYDDVVRY
ncbi:hypothetical protein Ancab_019696 [Ancistrocladus abbreviatus]